VICNAGMLFVPAGGLVFNRIFGKFFSPPTFSKLCPCDDVTFYRLATCPLDPLMGSPRFVDFPCCLLL